MKLMKHDIQIMSLAAMAALALAVSCTKDNAGRAAGADEAVAAQQGGITGEAPAFEMDPALTEELQKDGLGGEDTKTTLVYEASKGLNFFWNEDDNVAVFGGEGRNQQVPMFITDVAGKQVKTAVFRISQDYGLKTGVEYVAYCPIINPSMYLSASQVPFDYTGQTQAVNDPASTEHLGNFDYMVTAPTYPTKENVANFDFHHQCSPVYVRIANLPAGSYKKVTLKATAAVFTTKGTMDIFEGTSAATETSSEITLGFKKSVTVAAGGTIHAWIMFHPVSLVGKSVKAVLTTSTGSTVEYAVPADQLKNYCAGKAYHMAINE